MDLVRPAEARQLRVLAELADCNPFVAERVALEKAALSRDYRDLGETWQVSLDPSVVNPNLLALRERLPILATLLRDRLRDGAQACTQATTSFHQDMEIYSIGIDPGKQNKQ